MSEGSRPTREECEAILTHVTKASATISDLCHQRKRWVMSIPARRDEDPDLILGDAVQNCQLITRAYISLLDSHEQTVQQLQADKERLLEALTPILKMLKVGYNTNKEGTDAEKD